MRRLGRGAAASLAALLLSAPLMAQDKANTRLPLLDQTAATFKTAIDLVSLNVAVTDGKDKPVPGLGAQDFEVMEDGVRQDVSFFAAAELPIDVALLIDSSSSMGLKMRIVEQAAGGFIDALRPIDRGAVMSFASALRVLQPFTNDHQALKRAVGTVSAQGNTALYTALYVALDNFERARRAVGAEDGPPRRQAIIALTDGDDTASLIGYDQLLDRARRAGISIYSIVVSDGSPTPPSLTDARRYFNRSDYALKTLAQETGARAFFPVQLPDLSGVYQLVAEELSTQYALGYVPKLDRRDGTYRRIAVRIPSRDDARTRTRTGYYAPGPTRASR